MGVSNVFGWLRTYRLRNSELGRAWELGNSPFSKLGAKLGGVFFFGPHSNYRGFWPAEGRPRSNYRGFCRPKAVSFKLSGIFFRPPGGRGGGVPSSAPSSLLLSLTISCQFDVENGHFPPILGLNYWLLEIGVPPSFGVTPTLRLRNSELGRAWELGKTPQN